jgi:hypothetical protein
MIRMERVAAQKCNANVHDGRRCVLAVVAVLGDATGGYGAMSSRVLSCRIRAASAMWSEQKRRRIRLHCAHSCMVVVIVCDGTSARDEGDRAWGGVARNARAVVDLQ